MVRLDKELVSKVCNELNQINKLGKVFVYYKENKKHFEKLNTYYNGSKKACDGDCRLYKFKIVEENNWNRIDLDNQIESKIRSKIKNILKSYYPKMDVVDAYFDTQGVGSGFSSRPQYDSWYKTFNILVNEK